MASIKINSLDNITEIIVDEINYVKTIKLFNDYDYFFYEVEGYTSLDEFLDSSQFPIDIDNLGLSNLDKVSIYNKTLIPKSNILSVTINLNRLINNKNNDYFDKITKFNSLELYQLHKISDCFIYIATDTLDIKLRFDYDTCLGAANEVYKEICKFWQN